MLRSYSGTERKRTAHNQKEPSSYSAEIDAARSAHKEVINCQACHTGHRPASENNIPQWTGNCEEPQPSEGVNF